MQLPTSIPPATSDGTETDPTRRYRCRHVFTDGHRCGSPSLRQQELCYYHHTSRRGPSGGRGHFLMPRIDDRPAIQIAIYDILARIALGEIELKAASMLLYGLQIAASNLSQHEKSLRSAAANPEPLVEDVVSNPFLGDLAPIEELPDTNLMSCHSEPKAKNPRIPPGAPQSSPQPASKPIIPVKQEPSWGRHSDSQSQNLGSCLSSRARISRRSSRRVAKCFSSQSVNHPNCFSPETCSLAASGSSSSAASQRPQFAES
ncbi:MAG TPA: hypothetical protein VF865_04505 [Acidobacteriaceae bacterium]